MSVFQHQEVNCNQQVSKPNCNFFPVYFSAVLTLTNRHALHISQVVIYFNFGKQVHHAHTTQLVQHVFRLTPIKLGIE